MRHELWKPLDAGEIVQAGDQYDACSDPWRCDPIWVEVNEGSPLIGSTVPDPAFPAHTRYRRRFNDDEYSEWCEIWGDQRTQDDLSSSQGDL